MRIVPSPRDAKHSQQREATATDSRSRDNASDHLYELELAQQLPIFDLSKTLESKLLPSKAHTRLTLVMHRFLNSLLVRLFRVSLLCFGCLLFMPVEMIKPGIPVMIAAILLPPVVFVTFFSLDVLVLLARQYEFWFITALNTINWVALGVIFGDLRAVSCVGLWLSSQSVVLIDSNYRSFPTAVKSIIISGPFLILLVVCCSYNLVADASYPVVAIGKLTLQSRQVIVFTASTLVVFVVKKAYTKNRRLRTRLRDRENDPEAAQGIYTIPCVGLKARLKLSRRGAKSIGQLMRNIHALETRPAEDPLDVLSVQKLKLAPYNPLTVDARNVVLPGKLLVWIEAPYAQSAVYFVGVVGLNATAIAWLMVFYGHEQNSSDHLKLGVAATAAVCSLVFVFVAVALAQRDLLRLSAGTFDAMFSAVQGTTLALCLLDLLQWRLSSCLAVLAWWILFHFLLVLDALTPSLTRQLRFRKHFGLPAVLVMLAVVVGCALELIIGEDGRVFSSRLLWSVRVGSSTGFDLHTSSLAIQRTITIVGWFPRLLVELATGSPDQLLFIYRQVEYFSPFATFSDPAPGAVAVASNTNTTSSKS